MEIEVSGEVKGGGLQREKQMEISIEWLDLLHEEAEKEKWGLSSRTQRPGFPDGMNRYLGHMLQESN